MPVWTWFLPDQCLLGPVFDISSLFLRTVPLYINGFFEAKDDASCWFEQFDLQVCKWRPNVNIFLQMREIPTRSSAERCRTVGTWGGGGAYCAHPDFGSSINPIPQGGQIMSTTLLLPNPPDSQTFLRPWDELAKINDSTKAGVTTLKSPWLKLALFFILKTKYCCSRYKRNKLHKRCNAYAHYAVLVAAILQYTALFTM
jgi:hypothetical protein